MSTTTRVQKLITFSPQLYEIILAKAKQFGLSFGEYIRHLAVIDIKEDVDKGLQATQVQKSTPTAGFLKLAELGKRFKGTAPKDLSTNHDKYIWDE